MLWTRTEYQFKNYGIYDRETHNNFKTKKKYFQHHFIYMLDIYLRIVFCAF